MTMYENDQQRCHNIRMYKNITEKFTNRGVLCLS